MSDLFENHIVGIPTRQLNYVRSREICGTATGSVFDMRFLFNFTSKYKRLNSCTDDHLKMSSRYLWICSVAGILLFVVYTGR